MHGSAWGRWVACEPRMGAHVRGSRLGAYRSARLTHGGGVWAISACNLARMLQFAHVALSLPHSAVVRCV